MGQHNFKKPFEFHSFSEIFYCACPDWRTRIWVFLYNVNTQESFWEIKMWERACLRNIQDFKILMKYLTVAGPDSGRRVWVILYNVNTQELF